MVIAVLVVAVPAAVWGVEPERAACTAKVPDADGVFFCAFLYEDECLSLELSGWGVDWDWSGPPIHCGDQNEYDGACVLPDDFAIPAETAEAFETCAWMGTTGETDPADTQAICLAGRDGGPDTYWMGDDDWECAGDRMRRVPALPMGGYGALALVLLGGGLAAMKLR